MSSPQPSAAGFKAPSEDRAAAMRSSRRFPPGRRICSSDSSRPAFILPSPPSLRSPHSSPLARLRPSRSPLSLLAHRRCHANLPGDGVVMDTVRPGRSADVWCCSRSEPLLLVTHKTLLRLRHWSGGSVQSTAARKTSWLKWQRAALKSPRQGSSESHLHVFCLTHTSCGQRRGAQPAACCVD